MIKVVLLPEFKAADLADAVEIINAVVAEEASEFVRPDPVSLTTALEELQSAYYERKTIDNMDTLKSIEKSYERVVKTSKSLRNALNNVLESWSASYFFNDSDAADRPDDEHDHDDLGTIYESIERLIDRAEATLKDVAEAQGPDNKRRWYELTEGSAGDWLYGHGLPVLFERHFSRPYSIPSEAEGQTPGLRFARAVLKRLRLPSTGTSNLRRLARKGTRLRKAVSRMNSTPNYP